MMRKQELIKIIADRTQLTLSQTEAVLAHTFDAIKQLMMNQEVVKIPKFGSFSAKLRAAHKGHNPSTGQAIQIPERIVPYFKAASQLKAALNQRT